MDHLRLVKPAAPKVFAHENRMGVTYYLHRGETKTGKPRYFFAKTIGANPLNEIPDGFEVSESINAVVSVRRKSAQEATVPAADVTVVEAALAKCPHLRGYVARVVGNAVVIFEPDHHPAKLGDFAQEHSLLGQAEAALSDRLSRAQYTPVMKFEREGADYVAFRMTYRGKGGWSWALQSGKLHDLARKLVKSIGTEAFFELM